MFDLALKIFLLLAPVIYLPLNGYVARFQWYQFKCFSASPALLQLQFFQYGTIALFITALLTKPKRMFQDKYFGLMLFICVWNILFHPKTLLDFQNIFLGFLLYYLVVSYTENIKSVLKTVVVVSILNTVFAILQSLNINLIYAPQKEITGLMCLKSNLGIYQAMAIPICYSLNPFLSIIPLAGLLLSKSVTAFLPAVIGMGFLLRKKLLKMVSFPFWISLFTILGIIFLKSFHKLIVRTDVWLQFLKEAIKKPLYAYGLNNFHFIKEIPHTGYNRLYTDTYSIYFDVFHALGILGFIALILFIKDKFKILANQELLSACLIIALCGLGYSFFYYPRLAGTAIVLFGLLAISKGEVNAN